MSIVIKRANQTLQVLKWEDIEIGEAKDGEIRVRKKAIGVNFIDVNYRKGAYKTAIHTRQPKLIIHRTEQ